MLQARLIIALCAILFASSTRAVDPAVIEAQNRRIAVVDTVAPAVVAIFGASGGGGGSGILISPDGYALTNFHVTSSVGNFMKCGLNDGVLYDAVIVGIDPTGDVALIKLLGRDDFPTSLLGDSDTLKVGDWVFAMGNPFLLATEFQPTVTYGIVSGVHRYQYPARTFLEYTDCIQVDASINPGNSGGPLFNDGGELVGINGRASFEKRGRVNSGAAYAISINQIKHFMDHLRSGRIVDHATLGATVSTEPDGSVVIAGILKESEAYRRGLRLDDEIVSFAGRPIRSVNQFKNILGIFPKGWKLPLVYRHEGRKHEIHVRLRGLHHKSKLMPQQRRPRQLEPQPKKPDNKNPEGKKPKPQPGQLPRLRRGRPQPPEKHKHLFIQKAGYANYYFNKLQQDRVLLSLGTLGKFSDVSGTWRLLGQTSSAKPFEFFLSNKALTLEVGRTPYLQELDKDLLDEPPGTGGLLVALHHLRLLLTQGGTPFTEFSYLGSEPLDGRGEHVDVIISVLTSVESRWYFSKKDGSFVGYDTRLSDDVDACEVRFQGSAEFDGRKLPARLQVRSGGQEYGMFHLEQAILAASPKEKKPDTNDAGK